MPNRYPKRGKSSELIEFARRLGFTAGLNHKGHIRFEHQQTGKVVVCTPDTRGRNLHNSWSMLKRVARGAPLHNEKEQPMRLYELTAQYAQLSDAIEDGADDSALSTMLAEVDGALREKCANIGYMLKNYDAEISAMKAEEKRIADKRKAREAAHDRLNKYVLDNMIASGIHQIDCPAFSLKVRENPPSVVIDDEKAIPAEYMRQPPLVPDKRLMLDDMKQGVVIDGARTERGHRLEIK